MAVDQKWSCTPPTFVVFKWVALSDFILGVPLHQPKILGCWWFMNKSSFLMELLSLSGWDLPLVWFEFHQKRTTWSSEFSLRPCVPSYAATTFPKLHQLLPTLEEENPLPRSNLANIVSPHCIFYSRSLLLLCSSPLYSSLFPSAIDSTSQLTVGK